MRSASLSRLGPILEALNPLVSGDYWATTCLCMASEGNTRNFPAPNRSSSLTT